ncbi:allergen Arg r 1-like [Ornithodoros turicata]|uniref:allergen Arg r 1-like n=1 Tax=Ornithodoros turicata TaxID=34597 RepID=UPI00313A3496
MGQLMIYFVAFVLPITSSAQVVCPTEGTTDAWKSVKSRSSGTYYLYSTTDASRVDCSHVSAPTSTDETHKTATITFGGRNGNRLQKQMATIQVSGDDRLSVVTFNGEAIGTSKLLFSDYGVCDVVEGPTGHCDLWAHDSAIRTTSFGCCSTKFQECLKGRTVLYPYQEDCPTE